jgi:hypothetical protein
MRHEAELYPARCAGMRSGADAGEMRHEAELYPARSAGKRSGADAGEGVA